ncbi:MAG TPA: ABC transporter [Verrucomicrobiales bacterium]|nr:ABC transporter [Verrucomicrobiales bacterium]
MNELIPAFSFRQVFIEPWSETGGDYLWVVLMGFFVTAACGMTGVYLILRRMALVGDAISHSVLPGLAVAFLAGSLIAGGDASTGHLAETGIAGGHYDFRNPTLMFIGALVAGVLTTLLIELIHKKSRVKQDAAIGITFSSLFAIGVILVSLFAGKVDLDADCVLYGEIGFVAFQPFATIAGHELTPWPVLRMGVVFLLTAGLIGVFYKELLVSSFDAGLASSLGINPTWVHYSLMCWLSVVVVSAFEAVGAILVIAMLILPGATAALLTHRLPVVFILVLIHSAISSLAGLHLALWLECPTAGAMVVVGAMQFCLAWMFSPEQGLLTRGRRSRVEGDLVDRHKAEAAAG